MGAAAFPKPLLPRSGREHPTRHPWGSLLQSSPCPSLPPCHLSLFSLQLSVTSSEKLS